MKKEKAPFIYGKIVSSESFTNREDELKKILDNFHSGINSIIISPRRWGKSSLVKKALDSIKENKQIKQVHIDLFSVNSDEEFYNAYTKEVLKASSNKFKEWISLSKEFFKSLIPKFQFSPDSDTEFSLSFDYESTKNDPSEILNLPEKIAEKKKVKFIVAIDEFQNIAEFKDFTMIEKKMRAAWQTHKHVSYCLYGSKNHMMADIFDNPSKPFYRFGDIILLNKIKKEKWIRYIQSSFESTKKIIKTEYASLIADLMKCHSWYVQQFSNYAWNRTKDEVSEIILLKALEELINGNSPLYEKEVEFCSKTQVNLLKAIIQKEKKLHSVKIMKAYKLGTSNNVRKNLIKLAEKGIINKIDKEYELLDPAFEIWFKRLYFKVKLKHYFQS